MAVATDRSGLVLPQTSLVATAPEIKIVGSITYCCHTCGELITRSWEVFFVDDTPGREWASELTPPRTTKRTTTHHAAHMAG